MSIEITENVIRIVGNAPVGDAEPLLAAILEEPVRPVDLNQAAHLHSAIIQILLALQPVIVGTPSFPFFGNAVLPLLDRGGGTA
jgi:hypothetical protein